LDRVLDFECVRPLDPECVLVFVLGLERFFDFDFDLDFDLDLVLLLAFDAGDVLGAGAAAACAGVGCAAGCEGVPSAPPGPSGPVGPRLSASRPHGRLPALEPSGPEDPRGPSGPVGPRLGMPGSSPWLTLHDRPGSGRGDGVAAIAAAGAPANSPEPAMTAPIPPSAVLNREFMGVENLQIADKYENYVGGAESGAR
jgi:hypothetical protein